jgi:hypothetical protein
LSQSTNVYMTLMRNGFHWSGMSKI